MPHNSTILHVIVVLLILATIQGVQNSIVEFFGQKPSAITNLIFTLVLIAIYVLAKTLIDLQHASDTADGKREDFFFEVSPQRRCSRAFINKPSSFQFTQVGSGDCQPESMPPYGFINNMKSCSYGGPDPYDSNPWGNRLSADSIPFPGAPSQPEQQEKKDQKETFMNKGQMRSESSAPVIGPAQLPGSVVLKPEQLDQQWTKKLTTALRQGTKEGYCGSAPSRQVDSMWAPQMPMGYAGSAYMDVNARIN